MPIIIVLYWACGCKIYHYAGNTGNATNLIHDICSIHSNPNYANLQQLQNLGRQVIHFIQQYNGVVTP